MIVNVLTDDGTTVQVIQSSLPNVVEVYQTTAPEVVEIVTAGPQGPQGPAGATASTASFVTTSSFNAFTSSYNTGSFLGSFTGSLLGTSSWASNAISSSFATSASFAVSSSRAVSSSFAISSSNAISSSFAINAATASNILGGRATHIPFFITDTTLATSSLYQSGSSTVIINQDNATTANPEALYVWQPHPTSFNVISGKGDINNYLQLNIQNTNQGANASSDVVATANNGSENDNYIDMGINSQNFAGFLGGPNDSYLYTHAHNFWIGNINDGYNTYFINSSSLLPIITLTSNSALITGSLFGTASWATNAASASHATVADSATYATTAGNGGVTSIIAGSGITLPFGGTGNVTVVASGGGGVTIISGSAVTSSFTNSNTWTFNHNLGTRTPTITVFDSNYNQIIPQNISLDTTSSATITFPTLESGFAIASTGGTSGTALSSSYALNATYAASASYYPETDPVFVAKSASLATTGSNVFRGNQTVTGSLFTSGSNTLIGNTILTGSLSVSGSTLQTGNNTLIGNTVLSGSLSVSGSQIFKGDFDLTGSLTVTGSTVQIGNNTLTGNTSLTGSIKVSGSQTFVGTQTITGSVLISGSTTQVGNNRFLGNTEISGSFSVSGSTTNNIIGNTEVYGQFNVSGSSNFHNSLFTVTGSTFIKGVTNISGSTNITGSFNVTDGDINIVSGSSFTRWGNKLFNYGQFSDTTTQSGSLNTAYPMKFNTTDFALGVSVVSSSRITVANTGIYNLQFSAQVANTANTTITYDIWFAYTGSNIINSNTQNIITKVPGSTGRQVAAWNLATPITAGDYVEIYWSCDASTLQLQTAGTQTGPTRPAIPSVIATLTQIA